MFAAGPGQIWKLRQPPRFPPPLSAPRLQVSCWSSSARPPAGHLHDKGAAVGWEGAGERLLAERPRPAPVPQLPG